MLNLTLEVQKDDYTIHRFPPDSEIPSGIVGSGFYSITSTTDELSIVCSSKADIHSEKSEGGWSNLKILGPLDFSLTGILAAISNVLAREKISIFAISTFDTDYILVKTTDLERAITELEANGYTLKRSK